MRIPDDLYDTILRFMPIPCVDLLVTNHAGEVLLIRRLNEPAPGEWWFPGGRIHFLELRERAARRKLREECGVEAESITELKTVDVILHRLSGKPASHGITTIFLVSVADDAVVKLDSQSQESSWKSVSAWKKESLHPFVAGSLDLLPALP